MRHSPFNLSWMACARHFRSSALQLGQEYNAPLEGRAVVNCVSICRIRNIIDSLKCKLRERELISQAIQRDSGAARTVICKLLAFPSHHMGVFVYIFGRPTHPLFYVVVEHVARPEFPSASPRRISAPSERATGLVPIASGDRRFRLVAWPRASVTPVQRALLTLLRRCGHPPCGACPSKEPMRAGRASTPAYLCGRQITLNAGRHASGPAPLAYQGSAGTGQQR